MVPQPLSTIFWIGKRWSFRFADAVIVSNPALVAEATALNAVVHVLPDPIAERKEWVDEECNQDYCVFISSFAGDEPLSAVIQAARLLKHDLPLYWTGRIPKSFRQNGEASDNVIFTSYLEDAEYYRLIARASCLLVLTTEDECLVSGGYEGLAVGVPMILSNTKALKEYFGAAALYTSHAPEEIADLVRQIRCNWGIMRERVREIRELRRAELSRDLEKLQKMIRYV